MLVGLLTAIVMILLFFASLGWITGHGKYEKVPEIVGMNVNKAKIVLEQKGFKVIISDTVYSQSAPGLSITKQTPEGSALVKYGRAIYLSINSAVPPNIDMPSLIWFSYKSAEIYLTTMGLKMGDTTYRQDKAKNSVLEQLFNGQPIKQGTRIPKGSTISFVLGSGFGDTQIPVPDLVGLTLAEAKQLLSTLNVGVETIIGLDEIKDSATSYVTRQNPSIFRDSLPGIKTINKIRPGSTVDLYISEKKPIKDSTNTYPTEKK